MNELASVGIILLIALLAGHLVKVIRVPEVTGYILAGVAVGPSGFGWITHDNLAVLDVFSEVALGLILFSIGAVFEMKRLREFGPRVGGITVIESILACLFVTGGLIAAGQSWQVSVLLGAIAVETAAASTLMVIRECNSEGELTDTLVGLIAMNNILCLFAFSVASSAVALSLQKPSSFWEGAWMALFPLVWQLVGSAALGYLIGLLLAAWAAHVHEHGEILILLSGCVLLAVGVSSMLDLSPLVASLAVGATMVNLSPRSRKLFDVLARTDPPLYAIFFVIAGADLNLELLPSLGVLGLVYALGRTGGKLLGASWGAKYFGFSTKVQKMLGPSMLSQAGLAIGLVLITNERFPAIAPTVTTVVLAAVTIFELVGPIGAKIALTRSGESQATEEQEVAPVI